MPVIIEGLSSKLEFIGKAAESDKPYRIVMHWMGHKRFVLTHEDYPPRILRDAEIKERREPHTSQEDSDSA